MNALVAGVSYISELLPATVKDAAGLSPQISQDVRHITWLSVERVFWLPSDSVRLLLVVGYSDGFQIWDLQDHANAREILSKQDKPVTTIRLLPVPFGYHGAPSEGAPAPLGVAHAPLVAYLHRGAPALVRLFSVAAHDDVHLLRLTEPAKCLQASRRYFAVGLSKHVDLYDAVHFQQLFSVQCGAASCPTFALGHRWLAYNLPPQQLYASSGPAALLGVGVGGARQLPAVMRDGLQYLGNVGQKTLDSVLMPPPDDCDQQQSQNMARCGIVAVRDVFSRTVIAQFEDHVEPIDTMAWDPSGLQLVTCAAQGHQILVHRALLGAEHALLTHDAEEGVTLGSVVFQHLFTLSRGYTPAVISDLAVSDDGQFVAVSSAKGTTHIFRLPPVHSAALGRHLPETGAVRLMPAQPCASSQPNGLSIGLSLGGEGGSRAMHISASTRVKLGSALLREGLTPKCGFLAQLPGAAGRSSVPHAREPYLRMYIATRAGTLFAYALQPPAQLGPATLGGGSAAGNAAASGSQGGEGAEWQAVLSRESHVCRPLRHFAERRLSPREILSAQKRGAAAAAASHQRSPSPEAARSKCLALGPGMASPICSPWASPVLAPRASPLLGTRASPLLGPRASPWLGPRASPLLGPRASPFLGSRAASPGPGVQAASPGPGEAVGAAGAAAAEDVQRWLSQVETSTHVPLEVPLWLCPQLSFHTYPDSVPAHELNEALRIGAAPVEAHCRRRVVVRRPDRPGDRVRYDGVSRPGEERLSELFGGALEAAVGSGSLDAVTSSEALQGFVSAPLGYAAGRALPAVALAPAWGSIAEQLQFVEDDDAADGCNLAQVDGVGAGLEFVEEDWLQINKH